MTHFAIAAVRGRVWLQCFLLMLGLTSVFVLTHAGVDSSEGIYQYTVAEQIVKFGELGFPAARPGVYAVAPNGRTYASHEIGNSLFLLPVAFVNNRIEVYLTPVIGPARVRMITRFLFGSMGAVLCAAGAVFLYLNLRLVFDQSIRDALVSVLLFSFCSFYWSYSRMIFDGVLCAVVLSAGMLCLFLFARSRASWLLVAAFALLGFGFITRLSMALAIVAAAIYLLCVLGPRPAQVWRAAVVAILVTAPFVAWQLYYNHLRTGSPFMGAVQLPQYGGSNSLDGNMRIAIQGLLFSPGKSIFVYCPAALVSVFLIGRFWRRSRNEAIFVVVLSLFWLLLHAKLRTNWFGAWGWGPRHFLTLAPVLSLPFLVERFSLRSRPAKALTNVSLAFGFLLAGASIILNPLYRMELAMPGGGLGPSWLWSLGRNQAVDALAGVARNLHTFFFGGEYLMVPGASAANIMASNTLNLWWVTARRMGVASMPQLAFAVAFLAACACLSLWLLFQAGGDRFASAAASSAEREHEVESLVI